MWYHMKKHSEVLMQEEVPDIAAEETTRGVTDGGNEPQVITIQGHPEEVNYIAFMDSDTAQILASAGIQTQALANQYEEDAYL